MTETEQRQNIDKFTDDLINEILAEGIARGVPEAQQLAARECFNALGRCAKGLVGKVPAGLFAYACMTYGEAMDANLSPNEDQAGPREVFEHIDEEVGTGNE